MLTVHLDIHIRLYRDVWLLLLLGNYRYDIILLGNYDIIQTTKQTPDTTLCIGTFIYRSRTSRAVQFRMISSWQFVPAITTHMATIAL